MYSHSDEDSVRTEPGMRAFNWKNIEFLPVKHSLPRMTLKLFLIEISVHCQVER